MSNPEEKPKIAYEHGYYPPAQNQEPQITQKVDKGIPETLVSFLLGVLFGVAAPMMLKVFFSEFVNFLSPSQPLPVMGENSYDGPVDLNSTTGLLDQLTEKLAIYSTTLWVIALVYLFPIVYQLRVAVLYGKITQVLCLALTLLGPAAVLFILPLWGTITSSN